MKLYVKVWCPWCVEAQSWLDSRGYQYELVNVEASRENYDAMIQISGQSKTPTLQLPDGSVLPDFGTDELISFVAKHNLKP